MSFRENVQITRTACLAQGIYEMWFRTEKIASAAGPGQFVSLYSNDGSRLLPRPISICRIEGDSLRIVYRVVGRGTEEFSKMKAGGSLNVQGPLGNGYDVSAPYARKKALLLGGGIGIPPMLELAKQLDCEKQIVLGYRDELFLNEEFEAYGPVAIATEDGSHGVKGTVLDAVCAHGIEAEVIYACGPAPMLRAVRDYALAQGIDAYVSLEEKMACGIGACLSCVCQTPEPDAHSQVHNKRVCKEGPVFHIKEVTL